jgi:hypothetical protein
MSIREEYKGEAKGLMKGRLGSFMCASDVMFTILLRECFLTIRGDLNIGIKTKEGFYTKLTEIKEGVKEAWKERGD